MTARVNTNSVSIWKIFHSKIPKILPKDDFNFIVFPDFSSGKMEAKPMITAEVIEIAGNNYLTVKDYVISMKPKKVDIQLDNLLDGRGITYQIVNAYISSNSMQMFEEVKNFFEKFIAEEFKNIANKSLKKITFNDIFSPMGFAKICLFNIFFFT